MPPPSSRCVALLGGAGFIGRNLAETLAQRGHRAIIVDPALGSAAPTEMQPDAHARALIDLEAIEELLVRHRVDTVVHLASTLLPSSEPAKFGREMSEVLAPSFALMDHCARASIRFVLFSSGGTVYGDPGPSPARETQPLAPKSHYGQAKVMLEDYARFAQRRLGLHALVLRPSNPYGRHQRPGGAQGLVAVALGKALAGAPLEVWGSGEAVRDYLDVRDLADAVVRLIESGVAATFNIGSGVGHSVNDVLALVQRTCGKALDVQRRPARAADVERIVLDTSALRHAIDWRPRSFEAGLADFHRALLAAHGAADGR